MSPSRAGAPEDYIGGVLSAGADGIEFTEAVTAAMVARL